MNARTLHEMVTDSGCPPEEAHELARVLAPLAATSASAPAASPALEALFGEAEGTPDRHSEGAVALPLAAKGPAGLRTRTSIASAVVLAVASVGATGLSAAANTLPGTVQQRVSEFSRQYLPFEFPEPAREDQPLGQAPLVEVPNPDSHAAAGATHSRSVERTAKAEPLPAAATAPDTATDHPRRQDWPGSGHGTAGSGHGAGPGVGQVQAPRPRTESSSPGSGSSSSPGSADEPDEDEVGSTAKPPAPVSPEKTPVKTGVTATGLVTGWDKDPGHGDHWHEVRDRWDRFQDWHEDRDQDQDKDQDKDQDQDKDRHDGEDLDHPSDGRDGALDAGTPRGFDLPAPR